MLDFCALHHPEVFSAVGFGDKIALESVSASNSPAQPVIVVIIPMPFMIVLFMAGSIQG